MKGESVMNIGHLVLAVVGYSEDSTVRGRTLLQKTVYFLNELLGHKIDFAPHYYGPYSETVAQTMDSLVGVGLISESVEAFAPFDPVANFDAKRFTYKLTPPGEKVLRDLEKGENKKELDQVKTLVRKMQELAGSDYKYLSVAAKMHHILKRRQKPIAAPEISREADVLGWQLSKSDIDGVIGFLQELKLAKKLVR
jgi:uncharacterized protein YwgA